MSASEQEDDVPFALDELQTLTTEARGFSSDEMVACETCGRVNPPTRAACLYCDAPLPAPVVGQTDRRRFILRRLESWEQGVNIVLRPGAAISEQATQTAINALNLDAEQTRAVIEYALTRGVALPLVRVATNAEVTLVAKRLVKLDFDLEAVTDESLAIDKRPPSRVSDLEATPDGIKSILRARGDVARSDEAKKQTFQLAWRDLVLLVAGRIVTRRVETEERHRGARKPSELIESRELFSDRNALDLYGIDRRDERNIALHHWRIESDGFDFSSLENFGVAKALTAAENFTRLIEVLRTRADHVVFDDEYNRVRRLLDAVWLPDERTESHGIHRARHGAFNTAASTITSNEKQFTRYSRLRYYLMQSDSLRAAQERGEES